MLSTSAPSCRKDRPRRGENATRENRVPQSPLTASRRPRGRVLPARPTHMTAPEEMVGCRQVAPWQQKAARYRPSAR
jgi:hypothetical protein